MRDYFFIIQNSTHLSIPLICSHLILDNMSDSSVDSNTQSSSSSSPSSDAATSSDKQLFVEALMSAIIGSGSKAKKRKLDNDLNDEVIDYTPALPSYKLDDRFELECSILLEPIPSLSLERMALLLSYLHITQDDTHGVEFMDKMVTRVFSYLYSIHKNHPSRVNDLAYIIKDDRIHDGARAVILQLRNMIVKTFKEQDAAASTTTITAAAAVEVATATTETKN